MSRLNRRTKSSEANGITIFVRPRSSPSPTETRSPSSETLSQSASPREQHVMCSSSPPPLNGRKTPPRRWRSSLAKRRIDECFFSRTRRRDFRKYWCIIASLWTVFTGYMVALTSTALFARFGDASTETTAKKIGLPWTDLPPPAIKDVSRELGTEERGPFPETEPAPPHHRHAIPNVLIFTHQHNLLTKQFDFDVGATGNATTLTDEQKEWLALQQNVRSVTALHPDTAVRFLTDDDCAKSIRSVATETASAEQADALVGAFLEERRGMFKADLCRGAALYETGGVYLDVDVGVRMNLWSVVGPSTTFVTVRVHRASKHPGAFFQAFIGVTARHPVMLRYVELFRRYYQGMLPQVAGQPLGVVLLKRAFDEVWTEQPALFAATDDATGRTVPAQLPESLPNATVAAFRSLEDTTVELWQEVLYLPRYQSTLLRDVPPPRWGTRRACKFVVISSPHPPVTVPLYSRVAGSRMCPTEADTAEQQRRQRREEEEEEGDEDEQNETEESDEEQDEEEQEER